MAVVLRSAGLNFQTLVDVSRGVAFPQFVSASCVAIPARCVVYFFPFDLEHKSCDISEHSGKCFLMLRMTVVHFRFWWFSSPTSGFSTAYETRHFRFQNDFKIPKQNLDGLSKCFLIEIHNSPLSQQDNLLRSHLYIACALTPKLICLAVDRFVLYCLNCHLNI